jgi:hypothetical protein
MATFKPTKDYHQKRINAALMAVVGTIDDAGRMDTEKSRDAHFAQAQSYLKNLQKYVSEYQSFLKTINNGK